MTRIKYTLLLSLAWLSFFASKSAHAVAFSSDQIPLTAEVSQLFDLDMRTLLSDPGSGNLQWAVIGGGTPPWLTVDSSSQRMFGTPGAPHIGATTFVLAVQDGDGGAITQITMTVIAPPIWSENPLDLGKQAEDGQFQFDLKTKVTHLIGGPLSFTAENLPSWMSLSTSGILSGIPRRPDVGPYTGITFTATNVQGANSIAAFGEVTKTIHPPTWKGDPITLDDAFEDSLYSKSLIPFVDNFEQANLSFTLLEGPSWLSLTPAGILSGTPSKPHIGTVNLKAKVQSTIDGQNFEDETNLTLRVIHVNHAPVWNNDPIVLDNAKERDLYSKDLSSMFSDIDDGDTHTFEKVGGPNWATVTASGTITGTPQRNDVGLNIFQVKVLDQDNAEDVTTVQITVEYVNQAPYWTQNPVNLPNAKEREGYLQALSNFAKDDDAGDTLSFEKISGPTWASIASDGTIAGTPSRTDIGLNQFQVKVSDQTGASANVTVNVEVEYVNQTPYWTQSPVNLPNAKERVAYSANLSTFAKDDDAGDTLSFEKVSGPDWATIASDGTVSGTPQRPNVGNNQFQVRVKDQNGAASEVTVNINVEYVNQAPYWTQSPIDLPNAKEREAYSQDLSSFAKDDDAGDTLSFEKVSGPDWASISGNGTISGTPSRADLGANQFQVKVVDQDGASSEVTVNITVEYVNQAPYWTQSPIDLPNAREREAYSQDLSSFAKDDDAGDTLSFEKVSGPSWASISSSGTISGTPTRTDLGANQFQVRVVDQTGASSEVTVNITVEYVNQAPYWTQSPIDLPNAKEREAYSQNIASFAKDDDAGDTLSFEKVSGPDWASISGNGTLSGTPQRADLGANQFQVRVVDQTGASSTVVVNVTVEYVNQTPYWTQNPVQLPNAVERVAYSQSLASFAKDDDSGDTLSFEKVSGPSWASIANDGTVSGTPQRPDVGTNSFVVKLSDQTGASAEVTVTIEVQYVNQSPYWTQNPINLPDANEREAYSQNIASFAKDDDAGDTLSFAKVSGPDWASVASDGTLSGTPQRSDLGTNSFEIKVMDQTGASANVTVNLEVLYVNQSPYWTANPVTLPNAKEREAYSQSVAAFAKDDDAGDTLSFEKLAGPDWASIASDGTVSGTPQRSDLGLNQFELRVLDQTGAFANVTVNIEVQYVNQAPYWTGDPITLPNAKEREAYSQSLASFAKDDDSGDTLSFEKVSGPTWAGISSDGTISGTPQRADLGLNQFLVKVSDQSGASATVTAYVEVTYVNQAPYWTQNPINLPNAKERETYSQNIADFAKDDDAGDTLSFEKVSGPDWATIQSDGTLTGIPQRAHLGLNQFEVKVSDPSGASANVTVNIEVEYVNQAPYWTNNPVSLPSAVERVAYSESLAAFAKDDDSGDSLSFEKVSGPDWASIATDGTVSGTPQRANLGLNQFEVRVSDQTGASSTVTVNIEVLYSNQAPYWTANPVTLPNAKEREAYSQSVADFAKDDDVGDTLSFEKVSGPPWASIASDGTVTGTPQRADLGVNQFEVKVLDQTGASATVSVNIEVEYVNQAPYWTGDPITLPDAKEREAYSQSLASFAKDDDAGDTLSFEKVSGPTWAGISSDGTISGTPQRADLGLNQFLVKVSDQSGASSTVTAYIEVLYVNQAPYWTQNPINLPNANEREAYSQSIADFAKDDDAGDSLSFQKISGPDWASISADGVLSGTPQRADVGPNQFEVQVLDTTGASSNVVVNVEVLYVNQAPFWTQSPVNLPSAVEREAYSQSLASFAADNDSGDTLSFEKVGGPAWASINSEGLVTGTPQRSDVGPNQFEVKVLDQTGASATVAVNIEVLYVNQAPYWTANPVTLPNAKEREAYSQSVAAFAKDDDAGDTLSFEKVSGPPWASIASDGTVTGTPQRADLGLNQFEVRVLDQTGASATVAVNIEVEYVNQAPYWTGDPITLPNAKEREAYSQSLASFAKDDDAGDTLSFEKVSGPTWAGISSDGTISGTPDRTDLGLNQFLVKVSDQSGASSTVTAYVEVIYVNQAPYWTANPVTLPNAKEREAYSQSVATFAKDDDTGDTLSFEKVSGPAWASIASDGTVSGTPQRADLGLNQFEVKVLDQTGASATVAVNIEVEYVNQAPYWTGDPITLPDAKEREAYSQSLASFAKDDDAGDTLSFEKVSGPPWAAISSDGTVTGTPQRADLGLNQFLVKVSDQTGASSTVTAYIEVIYVNQTPYWTQNPIVLPSTDERVFYTQDFSSFAKDDDENDTLTFERVDGPNWGNITSEGKILGTPQREDVGLNQFQVKVKDPTGASATVTLEVTVNYVNQPPYWTANPIRLPDAFEDQAYSEDLNPFVKDDDAGDTLSISKISGPDWASISPDGKIFGTPSRQDLGLNAFEIQVSDQTGASDTATIQINVNFVNKAPYWTQNPINLPNAKEREFYSQNIANFAKDDDPGDELRFEKASGPNWASVASDGTLSGTPARADLGINTFQVRVKDKEGASAVVDVNVLVEYVNQAPYWTQNPVVLPNAKERVLYTQSLLSFAKDDDAGDTLTFSKISGPDWALIGSDGIITGTPARSDVGLNQFEVQVSDQLGATGTTTVHITVDYVNQAPYWTQNPITLPNAKERELYQNSVAQFAKDDDPNDTLSFSKIDGPDWLSVAPDGSVSGTPQRPDVGVNQFTLKVTDPEGASNNVTVLIEVEYVNNPPVWTQNPLFLEDAFENKNYFSNISQNATDADSDPLSFKKISGPAWLIVGTDGALTGLPKTSDIGDYDAVFEVSDGLVAVQVDAKGKVLPVNDKPEIVQNPIIITIKEREVRTINIDDPAYVFDPDGDELNFQLISSADWVSLSTDGELKLSPLYPQIGEHNFSFQVHDGELFNTGALKVIVERDPRPPVWIEDPIHFTARTDMLFLESIADKANDLDGLSLVFSKVSGPNWLTVSTSGRLSGTPLKQNLGENTFKVLAKNDVLGAEVTVIITVVPGNTAPYWTANPIPLGTAEVNSLYRFDISPYAKDEEDDELRFRLLEGPSWLNLSPDGRLSGIPLEQHIGPYIAVFEVTDGEFVVRTTGKGEVVDSNVPPKIHVENLSFTVKAKETLTVNLNDPRYVEDADGDTLTFSLTPSASWVNQNASGPLTLMPQEEHIGQHAFLLTVNDGTQSAVGTVNITVLPNYEPPVWTANPIYMEAIQGQLFSGTLADKVSDPNGLSLTFAKLNGPTWLALNPTTGGLSGIPPQVGQDQFTILADNTHESASVALIINVRPPVIEHSDTVQIDTPVPGAKAENLWVVDSSKFSRRLMNALTRDIDVYYNKLDNAEIHHSGIFISSDAQYWKGKPIYKQDILLNWQHSDVSYDFVKRVNKAYSYNACNTPIWSMLMFYELLPDIDSIYMKDYFRTQVPMDAMILTQQKDHFRHFAKGTPYQGFSAQQYAEEFKKIHSEHEKPYRISVVAPECPHLTSEIQDPQYVVGGVADYKQLTKSTGGTYYPVPNCNISLVKILKDYAEKVIERAYILAKTRIKLSKIPDSSRPIEVMLAGTLLSEGEHWQYHPTDNEIEIFWFKLDLDVLKAGDKVTIKYWTEPSRSHTLAKHVSN